MPPLYRAAVTLHVLAALFWLGGMFLLGVVGAPVLPTEEPLAGELLRPAVAGLWLRWAVVPCGLAQIGGVGLCFFTMWSRIRPVGSHTREAKGERF